MSQSSTTHTFICEHAKNISSLKDGSVHLVVTSPPYPMIEMWDEMLGSQNSKIKSALENKEGKLAFELMHQELDNIWNELKRVMCDGGIACINIGDATRTINGEFSLYPNHARVMKSFLELGFTNLPNIIWRKQTNAPNKFMGAGMLPAGAYVTLEHEWILVFRKGSKRTFNSSENKLKRRKSAFFWEERNNWFSDLWDFKGIKQQIKNSDTRKRSAAYPFEIPYRLINMYSLIGDTVLDPFLGTGTTSLAAITLQRNSVGIDIDEDFIKMAINELESTPLSFYHSQVVNRIKKHKSFIHDRIADNKKKEIKHFNAHLNTPVITSQEKDILLSYVTKINISNHIIKADYKTISNNENAELRQLQKSESQMEFKL